MFATQAQAFSHTGFSVIRVTFNTTGFPRPLWYQPSLLVHDPVNSALSFLKPVTDT